jgi:hypothetical protein
VPFNERARIGSSFNISGGNLDIDIASVLVTGSFSLKGGPFPATDEDVGRLILRDTAAGADNELALTKVGGYSRRVILGTYDIVYQHLQGDLVPKNQDAVLGEVAVKSAGTIDINVAAGYFAAPVNHNGVLFPASPLQMGNILLRNPASEDYLVLGKTSLQNLSAKVIPGTYDVYYSHLNGDQVPQNSMARIMQGLIIDPPGPTIQGGGLSINVDSVVMTGQMLLNNALMPASEYDYGLVRLLRESDTVLLGHTHDQTYGLRVVKHPDWAGFNIHYGVETLGDFLPANGDARVMCILLDPLIL